MILALFCVSRKRRKVALSFSQMTAYSVSKCRITQNLKKEEVFYFTEVNCKQTTDYLGIHPSLSDNRDNAIKSG